MIIYPLYLTEASSHHLRIALEWGSTKYCGSCCYLPPHECGPRTTSRVGSAVGAFVVRVLTLDDGIVTERRGGADDAEGGGHRAWFGVVLVQKACRRRMEAIYRHFTAAVDMWLLGLSSSTHVWAEDGTRAEQS